MHPSLQKTTLMLVLDGFGLRDTAPDNAISYARTPTWDHLIREMPHSVLQASGAAVGLPEGQMGNSEVGHLTLGAGRVALQSLPRIDQAIQSGSIEQLPLLNQALDTVIQHNSQLHLIGLLSAGGIHSHEEHLFALCRIAAARWVRTLFVHAITDGRDTAPMLAQTSIKKLDALFSSLPQCKLASLVGRYYAMDRDQRWERTQAAYQLLTDPSYDCHTATSGHEAIQRAYDRHETDEFIQPTRLKDWSPIQDNDVVLMTNFRADRARQLSHALMNPEFSAFPQPTKVNLGMGLSMTHYDDRLAVPALFPTPVLSMGLGELLASHNKKQLRIAESEKYAHVTFFFNGGREQPWPGESRLLMPSPKVRTYDLCPEMSVNTITDKLIEALQSQTYDYILCNFANADMVGHTGHFTACVQAIEAIDRALTRLLEAIEQTNSACLITADHGNAEQMRSADQSASMTSHTLNPVPCIYINHQQHTVRLHPTGTLSDVAPTILDSMQLPIPELMTGQSLLRR